MKQSFIPLKLKWAIYSKNFHQNLCTEYYKTEINRLNLFQNGGLKNNHNLQSTL